jgi:F-type H+-transporting ATPase subunit delta
MDTAQDSRFAAELNADVDVEKIAEVYAKAYFNAVAEQNVSIDDAVAEFASFVEILKSQQKLAAVLSSAMVSTEEKVSLLEKAIAHSASPLFWSFIKIVAKRNRLDILFPIFVQIQALLDELHHRVPVLITTATEVDGEFLSSLSEKLRSVVGGEPVIKNVVDPAVIGGILVRVGDTVYDASILTQLKNVRQQMIEQSASEIQRRRDHFRSTEG